VANTRIRILDPVGQLLPVGVPGELHIDGVQVGPGYLGKPELTETRFSAAPDHAGQRSYRSGDRARYRDDGVIEYLGRTDDQVKWRGFRIEPGEIEARLQAWPEVAQAAVILRSDAGEQRLVAYVVPDADQTVDTTALLDRLRAELPKHMVPSHIVVMQALPLTPSGKLARRQLPAPVVGQRGGNVDTPPESRTEQALAAIWADLLQVESVGRDDDFFDLGGHSLLTIKLIKRIEAATGKQLSIADVFENPTLRELSCQLGDIEWTEAAPRSSGRWRRMVSTVTGWLGR
jgi:hypothetical protein